MNLIALIARLKLSEGFRSHFYFDTRGNITIGYGHNLGRLILPPGVRWQDIRLAPANGVTPTIAEALLTGVLLDSIERLRREIPWFERLDAIRQEVLADMAFNMGVRGTGKPRDKKGLVDGWPNFLGQVQRGEYEAAARNMLGTPWRRQVGDRAVRLAYMMQHGKEP